MMGGAGQMPEWLVMAMPFLVILGVVKALYSAAQRPKGSVRMAAIMAVFAGTWVTALGLWSWNYVLTLPGHDPLRVSRYGLYLFGDLALLGGLWALLAWGVIRLARHRAAAES